MVFEEPSHQSPFLKRLELVSAIPVPREGHQASGQLCSPCTQRCRRNLSKIYRRNRPRRVGGVRLNKSLHACRLRLRTKANRCNHGHLTSRITEVIDTQHHVSLKYSKRSLCAVCRQIFPGTRSERGGNTAARRPFHHRLS